VLTTLHTNSAVSAMTRLVDIGVEPYMVASALSAVVAQRLVRRPCPSCAVPDDPDPALLQTLGLDLSTLAGATPLRGEGCADCGTSGYRGRTGIYEVLLVDQHLRRILGRDPTERAIVGAATGLRTLRDAAVAKALAGETTFQEVARVSPRD
jgi:type IV pilus assembly protein PilB